MNNCREIETGYMNTIDITGAKLQIVNEDLADMLNMSIQELKEYPGWIYLDRKYYYFKKNLTSFKIINELLCSEIASTLSLDAVKYEIASLNHQIEGLLSESFRDLSYNYSSPNERSINIAKNILLDKDYYYDYETKRQYFMYILLVYYTSLQDREVNNLIKTNSKYDFLMAPLYDFELSFYDKNMDSFKDPLSNEIITPDILKYVNKNNLEFNCNLSLLLNMDFEYYLDRIEEKYNIYIPNEYRLYYKEFINVRKENIKKYVK